MALQKKLLPDEIALLEVLQDPIWLGEFLRTTSDFAANKEEWRKGGPFTYRWYQRDLLTDKSPYVCLTAGRAVGKCHTFQSRIYVHPFGYMRIIDIIHQYKKGFFITYGINNNGEFEQKRATIVRDGYRPVYRVTTSSGFVTDVTDNHPFLTPDGFVMLQDLKVTDLVAVASRLPAMQTNSAFSWAELRWLGYVFLRSVVRVQMAIEARFTSNIPEIAEISRQFDTKLIRNRDGSYNLVRKLGAAPHAATRFLQAVNIGTASFRGAHRIPLELKAECLNNVKIFLESLFSAFAHFSSSTVYITFLRAPVLRDIQELLLRFGVETNITSIGTDSEPMYKLELREESDYYKFFTELKIPGVAVKNLKQPAQYEHSDWHRFEEIVSIEERPRQNVYTLQVYDLENYIGDGMILHNSVVLEDKMVFNAVNSATEFPMTKEAVLVTANTSQMTPLLDHVSNRFLTSPLLKHFLNGQINRTKGTMDFVMPGGTSYRLYSRIAGSRGENNMVGLHIPKIYGDEMQLFPMAAWTQLQPTLNTWEDNIQVFVCGVPNGVRDGSVLYMLDQKSVRYKKYRIPATENPYWFADAHVEAIKQYGGEESDDFQRLVLGRHGDAAYAVIPRDKMVTEPFEFYSYRYNQSDRAKGTHYKDALKLPTVPKQDMLMLAIDTGYTDPTVIQLMGRKDSVWRTFARWRLTRIAFPEQADIIDWIDAKYQANGIGIDLGPGGGGIGIMQDLQSSRFGTKMSSYAKKIIGVNFGAIQTVDNFLDNTLQRINAKSHGGEELARMVSDKELVFSELDAEGMSQLERVAYQRRTDGANTYFVLSERGIGKSQDDHIFASYLVFILALGNLLQVREVKKLVSPTW
jgi:hypothetical protein